MSLVSRSFVRFCSAAFLTSLASGCLDAPDDPVAPSVTAAPITGFVLAAPLAGIEKITVVGQADTHTGILLSPDLVMTSGSWIGSTTAKTAVEVLSGAGTTTYQRRVPTALNRSDFFPAAVLQVDDFTGGHARPFVIDTRPSANLANVGLRCYEYVGDRLRYADVRVTSVNADQSLNVVSAFGTTMVDATDAGAPCIDTVTNTAIGMVWRLANGLMQVYRYNQMQVWIDGLVNLAQTRDTFGSTQLSLYTVAPNGQRMCLDIPWGSPYDHELVNAYPCHYGQNQRFWLDYRADVNRPRFVSETSGRCIDVPSGLTTSGLDFQQYGCHSGWNQRFDLSLWGDAAGGWKVRPAHVAGLGLCLSVEGGPSSSAHATEQRPCVGTADQRWFPVWQ